MAHHWFSQHHLTFPQNFTMGKEEDSPLIDSVLCAFHLAKRSPGIQSAQAPCEGSVLTVPTVCHVHYHDPCLLFPTSHIISLIAFCEMMMIIIPRG